MVETVPSVTHSCGSGVCACARLAASGRASAATTARATGESRARHDGNRFTLRPPKADTPDINSSVAAIEGSTESDSRYITPFDGACFQSSNRTLRPESRTGTRRTGGSLVTRRTAQGYLL